MSYANIFKAPAHTGFKWQLFVTDTVDLSKATIKVQHLSNNKTELKQIAKNLNAKAWNY